MSSDNDDDGNEKEKQSAKPPMPLSSSLSPIVTAQDRKKRILERRRKSAGLLTRSQSMPLQPKRRRPENTTHIFARSGSTSRSNLFAGPEISRLGDYSSSNNVQTRLFSSDLSNDVTTTQLEQMTTTTTLSAVAAKSPKKRKAIGFQQKSSLYGLVMQRTTAIDSDNDEDERVVTPKLDKKSRSRTAHLTAPLTPSQRLAKQLASPGGFGLLQMLNTVTSPFKKKKAAAAAAPKTKSKDEWQEARLHQILDWTIHSKIRLECHPPTCLPQFSGNDGWTKALQYWQFPVRSALVNEASSVIDGTAAVVTTAETKLKGGSSSKEGGDNSSSPTSTVVLLAKQLVNAVRGPKAYIQQLVRSDEGLVKLRYRRQWQDAFAALYQTWMNKMDDHDDYAKAYFYATKTAQAVLFRATVYEQEVIPMIVLSATTKEMRDYLHTRDVKLYMLEGSQEFHEVSFGDDDNTGKNDNTTQEEEFMVHSDMEALRKAQAFGETAGADVTVKAPSKRTLNHAVVVPPVYLRGHDDCGVFATYFLNQEQQCWCLLSRMGPFLNATTKSLIVSRQRVLDDNATIELLGPILPCAIPALVATTARTMRKHHSSAAARLLARRTDDDSGLGTHYFVLQALPTRNENESDRDQNCGLKVAMNGSSTKEGEQSMMSGDVCSFGERVDAVVWDISRPTVTTYKLDAA